MLRAASTVNASRRAAPSPPTSRSRRRRRSRNAGPPAAPRPERRSANEDERSVSSTRARSLRRTRSSMSQSRGSPAASGHTHGVRPVGPARAERPARAPCGPRRGRAAAATVGDTAPSAGAQGQASLRGWRRPSGGGSRRRAAGSAASRFRPGRAADRGSSEAHRAHEPEYLAPRRGAPVRQVSRPQHDLRRGPRRPR